MILILGILVILFVIMFLVGMLSKDDALAIPGFVFGGGFLIISILMYGANPSVVESIVIKKQKEYTLDVELSQYDKDLAKIMIKSGGTPIYIQYHVKKTKDGDKPTFWTWPMKRYMIDNKYWVVEK